MSRFISREERLAFNDDTTSGFSKIVHIITDTETGVQYFNCNDTGIGFTLLVDREGKPLLDPKYSKMKKKPQK